MRKGLMPEHRITGLEPVLVAAIPTVKFSHEAFDSVEDAQFYSAQWRTWEACFVQAAWRQYYKRKQAAKLREAEEKLQDALANEGGTVPSLGVAIYASKFTANVLRNLRQNGGLATKTPQGLALLPQKPVEPDFSADRL